MSVSKLVNAAMKPLQMVIVGGVAGGATAAARARRVNELSKILLLERGKNLSVASCGLPYFVSQEITDRSKLTLANPEKFRQTLNVDARVSHEVESIDRQNQLVKVRNLLLPKDSDGSIFSVRYDKLLLATGAGAVVPPIPGLRELMTKGRILTLRNLEDMDMIVERVRQAGSAGRVVVVGAGLIGLEMVEALVHRGLAVTVVEGQSTVLPLMDTEFTVPVADELAIRGVSVLTSQKVVGFKETSSNSIEIQLESGLVLPADFVIQSIGVRPESKLAEDAGLTLTKNKAIQVNQFMQTSDPNIYAAGDVAATPFVQSPKKVWLAMGGPANRMARIAADHMMLGDAGTDPYRGSFGTSIVRVFDTVAGRTGLSERECVMEKIPYSVATVQGPSHASYYPGSFATNIKVLYDPDTGKLLGAQAVGGREGVDKRLDIISTALTGQLTIDDLAHLDLAYAPPFGSARDVVNTAGFLGRNARAGMVDVIQSLAFESGETPLVLDVRDPMMATLHPIPDAANGGCDPALVMNVYLDNIRSHVEDIKAKANGRTVITVCNTGKTSYFAARILAAHGVKVKSLQGGMSMLRGKKPTTLSEPKPRPTPSCKTESKSCTTPAKSEVLDVCGLACPGPIMEIKKKISQVAPGTELHIKASDPGFYNDFQSFCRMNNMKLVSVEKNNGLIEGKCVVPGTPSAEDKPAKTESAVVANNSDLALVVFSCEMDKVLAAFVIANGALAMGGKVTMFFTFWGLNALKPMKNDEFHTAKTDDHHKHTMMEKMLGMMLPKDLHHLPLSHLNMGGAGQIAMQMQMKEKNLPTLPGLIKSAIDGGARLVSCTMSMTALGIDQDQLIEGVELGGVADFLEAAGKAKTTLFI